MTMQKPLTAALAALTVAGLAGAAAAAPSQSSQPHMERALNSLQEAKRELAEATRDKAGHRGRAAQLVDQAIGEVQAGMVSGAQAEGRLPSHR